MTRTNHSLPFIGLCILLLFALSACSDDTKPIKSSDPDTEAEDTQTDTGPNLPDDKDVPDSPDVIEPIEPSGFKLSGQLVPTGGLSMSDNFTLSGSLNPEISSKTSSSTNFTLKLKPPHSKTP